MGGGGSQGPDCSMNCILYFSKKGSITMTRGGASPPPALYAYVAKHLCSQPLNSVGPLFTFLSLSHGTNNL